MKKTTLYITFMLFMVAFAFAVGTTTLTLPADNHYELDGEVQFTVNGSPEINFNITSIDLYSNSSGTWQIEHTLTVATPTNNTGVGNVSVLTGLSDATRFLWNARINYTNASGDVEFSIFATSNKSVFVEFPPQINLNNPTDGQYLSARSEFAITVDNSNTTTNLSKCSLYTNESGTWTKFGPQLTANNNTQVNTSLDFQDGNITWNAQCWDSNDANIITFAPSNFTFVMDKTPPVVVVNTTNETWSNTAAVELNFTITDSNPDTCELWINTTGSGNYVVNTSTTTLTTAVTTGFSLSLAPDNNWTYYFTCNDTANNRVNSSFNEIRVDTITPSISTVTNASRANYCDEWNVNVTTNEATNISIKHGTTTGLTATAVGYSTLQTSHDINLSGQLDNTLHYFNVTACDAAGNCNTTESGSGAEFDYTFGFGVCSGWTYLGIYETRTNLSNIIEQSGASQVYTWNATGQDWVFYLGAGGAGGDEFVYYGDMVALFQSSTTNSSWLQNRTGTGYYNYNITSGDNYLVMTDYVEFGDLVGDRLMNDSDSWGSAFSQTPDGVAFNFSFMDVYNNSALDWHGGYFYDVAFNSSFNNETPLNKSSGLEVVWLYSNFNVTWNGTAITANWTRT